MDIEKLKTELDEKRSLVEEKRDDALQLVESDKVEEAKDVMKEIEALAAEVKVLAEKIEEFEKEEKAKTDDEEQEDDRQEVNTEERNLQNLKGEDDEMTFRKVEVTKKGTEERTAFDTYLEKRDITDGLKLDSGYAVIPEETVTEIIELSEDVFKLRSLVTEKKVETPSGKQPVRTTTKAKLSTVEELNASPEIAVTPFTEVAYEIETKRGYIPVSEELKADGVNVVPDLKKYLSEVIVNTENDDIMTVLKSITNKAITTADEIKDIVNVELPVGSNIQFLMSQTVYNEIDKLKDGNGRYLFQDSISSPSGKMLFGRNVIVLNDAEMPNKDTMFIGDFKEIVYFDRSQLSVQWTNYLHYGECLGVAVRNDVGRIKNTKIKKVTFKPEVGGVEG